MALLTITNIFTLVLLFKEDEKEEKTENVIFLEVLFLNQ